MTTLAPGQLLAGKYRIERQLGEGGMGAVFLAENVHLGRRVAIKVLLPQGAQDATMAARFRQEARAAAAIGHPGIVDVLDLGQTEDGAEFIVMEHLRGETLGGRLDREGRLALPDALAIVGHLLDALQAAHAAGIVHRDLKPENVFLVSEPVPVVKILDFGISKLTGKGPQTALTMTGALMGSPLYMPPEQAQGARDVGPAADLYALGAMIYRMLAGRPLFVGQTWPELLLKIVGAEPEKLSLLRPDLPPALCALVMQLVAKEPAARPQSAADVRARLAAVGAAAKSGPPKTGGALAQTVAAPAVANTVAAPAAIADTVAAPAAVADTGAAPAAVADTVAAPGAITGTVAAPAAVADTGAASAPPGVSTRFSPPGLAPFARAFIALLALLFVGGIVVAAVSVFSGEAPPLPSLPPLPRSTAMRADAAATVAAPRDAAGDRPRDLTADRSPRPPRSKALPRPPKHPRTTRPDAGLLGLPAQNPLRDAAAP